MGKDFVTLHNGSKMPVFGLGTWQLTDDPTLVQLAARYKKSPAQILIRWDLQLGTVPIPKANQKQHLEENIDVFSFKITDEDMKLLHSLNEKYSSLGYLPYI